MFVAGSKMQSKTFSEKIATLAIEAKTDPAAFGRLCDHYVQPVYRYIDLSTFLTKTYGNSTWGTKSGGPNTHGVTLPARNTDSGGGSASTNAPNVALPPYQEVIFCKKN